jgi:uncharacterized protein (TIGR02246 family)
MSQLDDVDEIRQLIARYCHLVDARRIEEWVDCFTDDAVFEVRGSRHEGRDALLKLGQGLRESGNRSRHWVTNVLVDVDGDHATSESYLMMLSATAEPALLGSGVYRDRVRRVDGRWRFAERIVTFDGA